MATIEDDGSLNAEVSNRLDELFGDEDPNAGSPPSPKKSAAPVDRSRAAAKSDVHMDESAFDDDKDSPIKNLKALVFSIDWEITDETMVAFLKEIKHLQQIYQNDKILSLFLKLHESIGKYIKAKKARANPDSIKLAASFYKNFEKVLLTPGMNEVQKKKLLSGEVKKFKEFKQRVLMREGAMPQREDFDAADERMDVRVIEKAAAGPSMSSDSKELADYIIEEIRKTIKAEFHTLRQIIKNLGA